MLRRGDHGVYRRRSGAISYGYEWGTIMLDFDSPFVPGDMGNAATYKGHTLFSSVPGLSVRAILGDEEGKFQQAVISAAQELVANGAHAITSNCGFMIRYQSAVARAVPDRPVILSSLVQLPVIAAITAPHSPIGIITADSKTLTSAFIEREFPNVGNRVRIAGLEQSPSFKQTMFDGHDELDANAICKETVDAASRLLQADPEMRMLLLECAALPAYASSIQAAWPDVLVYDFTTAMSLVDVARDRTPFHGHY